jgi:hypothetical protein
MVAGHYWGAHVPCYVKRPATPKHFAGVSCGLSGSGLPQSGVQLRYVFHGYSHGSKTFGGYIPITSDIAMSLPICEPHVILVIVYRQRSRVDLALLIHPHICCSGHRKKPGLIIWDSSAIPPVFIISSVQFHEVLVFLIFRI